MVLGKDRNSVYESMLIVEERIKEQRCSPGPKYLHSPHATSDDYQANQAPYLPQLSPTRGFIHHLHTRSGYTESHTLSSVPSAM